MHYIGLMSGTSVDAIDAVLATIDSPQHFDLLATHSHRIPRETRQRIQTLMRPGGDELERAGSLDVELGRLFAEAANSVCAVAGLRAQDIRAIGSHGQTLRHSPQADHPHTLQIGNASVIAEATGITTVADFRARDLAAGGQGAPLVSAFHQWRFQKAGTHRAIVNIGGIANVTYLPADPCQPVIGYDTGPGNTLLDAWMEKHQGQTFDRDGHWASGGKPSSELLVALLGDPYFARPAPKSTGRDYFHLDWLERHLHAPGLHLTPQDVQASLVELSARSLALALLRLSGLDEIYLCGGGVHNTALTSALKAHVGKLPLLTTENLGLAPDWVEASAFAWLAHRTLEALPGNLPSVTGATRAVILGGIYRSRGFTGLKGTSKNCPPGNF